MLVATIKINGIVATIESKYTFFYNLNKDFAFIETVRKNSFVVQQFQTIIIISNLTRRE